MASYWFDRKAAALAEKFFARHIRHVEGEWQRQPFILEGWQRKIVRNLFGWKREDGTRKYRTAFVEVPRKNGKSTTGAGVALKLLHADGEPGPRVYGAASDREQAALVFDTATGMTEFDPKLDARSRIFKRSIYVPATRGRYEIVSSDVQRKHGFNASGLIIDELHAHKSRKLWDVLRTSTGARRQPLTFAMTTAGDSIKNPAYHLHVMADKILRGVVEDPSFYAVIYAAKKDEDWQDPRVWAKANPNLGISLKRHIIEDACNMARNDPASLNTFLQLHLNIWVQQVERYIDLRYWDRCYDPGFPDDDWLAGRTCFGGLDLASSEDLTAFSLVFPPADGYPYLLLTWFWLPEETVNRNEGYQVWERDGWLTKTMGPVIDHGYIKQKILEISEEYDLRSIGYDPWNATQIALELEGHGIPMFPVRQGYKTMNEPTKELKRLIMSKGIAYDGNPVLRDNMDSFAIARDPAACVKPARDKSSGKIDGVVASIMALDRALRDEGQADAYAEHGITYV